MATNGLTTLLIARLDHQDAIARLNLLKLIKVSRCYSCMNTKMFITNASDHCLAKSLGGKQRVR